jgi:glutamate synthase domain-containing protein 1
MCGIVGIYSKAPHVSEQLGAHVSRMLVQLADRGPDSAGIAVYRDPSEPGSSKLSLYAPAGGVDWQAITAQIECTLGVDRAAILTAQHALFAVAAEAEIAERWVAEHLPGLRVISAGRTIEIYKDAVDPATFVDRFGLEAVSGTHALGHTRMATESRVTTQGSHPFSTGLDICLVHNGSLSNHNRLRRRLQGEGVTFQTENDTEVAAAYLTWRMGLGDTLEEALGASLRDLDGFFTFAVGTASGFAVLRDPFACKPAVMAETDDWVAMASEYRALAVLPGAEQATVWEPEPGRVYSWGGVLAR